MRLLLLPIALILLSASVRAEDRPLWYDASEAVAVVGHSIDLASTQRCLGSGRCRELNPWLGRFDNPVAFAAAKMTVASVGLWATRKIPNKTLGAVVNYGIGAAFVAIGARNERIGR
jgi:hypothetical protein